MKDRIMAEKYTSTAKVIDGVLVLSLPDAISPVVWQMELGQSKASALEIRTTDNGQFILTLKTPRQDVLDIASYASRDQAIKALLAASAALEKAQGQLKAAPAHAANSYPVPVVTAKPSTGISGALIKTMKISGLILGTLVLILLIGYIVAGTVNAFMSAGTAPATSSSGAAVSADEFLENR